MWYYRNVGGYNLIVPFHIVLVLSELVLQNYFGLVLVLVITFKSGVLVLEVDRLLENDVLISIADIHNFDKINSYNR